MSQSKTDTEQRQQLLHWLFWPRLWRRTVSDRDWCMKLHVLSLWNIANIRVQVANDTNEPNKQIQVSQVGPYAYDLKACMTNARVSFVDNNNTAHS